MLIALSPMLLSRQPRLAKVLTQVARVVPFYYVPAFDHVLSAAIVGVPIIYAIHPSAPAAAIKFIKVVYSFYILVALCAGVLHMQLILIAHGAQNIKNRIPLLKRHCGGFEYLAACGDYPLPLFFKMHPLCNGGIAPYRYGAGIRLRLFTAHGSRGLLGLYGFGSYFHLCVQDRLTAAAVQLFCSHWSFQQRN